MGELDPVGGVMVRGVWFDRGGVVPGRLLLVAHHLVVDGVSWRVVVGDLGVAWEALSAGRDVVLGGVGTSFRGWARLLEEEAVSPRRVGELGMWEEVLRGPDGVSGAGGVDGPEGAGGVGGPEGAGDGAAGGVDGLGGVGGPGGSVDRVGSGGLLGVRGLDAGRDVVGSAVSLSWVLSGEVSEGLLSRVPSVFFCGVDEVLLAGFAVAFGGWRRARGLGGSLLVDVEGHGRDEVVAGVDVSRTVGWFTCVRPVRVEAGVGVSVGEVLRGVKECVRGVPDGGVGFGLLRYVNGVTGGVLEGLGVPEVAFNYLGRFPVGRDVDWGLAVESGVVSGGGGVGMPLSHVLSVNAVTRDLPGGSEVSFSLTWAGGVLDEVGVRELGDAWVEALGALVVEAGLPGAGGRTPSDLPLVSLSQAEIDQ
ncbi:condensation domain-containing protein, partial [Streptomyces sp. NPDC020141]|uniref:condensation domain-containing protein n=1 Tax=Streptomyces sp. NPDC020141 TaxID=3365065 RepID=UPI0037BD433C